MKWSFWWLCLSLMTQLNLAHGWQIAPVSSLQKLTASAPGVLEPFEIQSAKLKAARGEWENFQVVVTADDEPLQDVQLEPTGLASFSGGSIAPENFQIFRENFVFVAQPSGNRRLEKLWWPDALIPQKFAEKTIEAQQSAVFWVSFYVPPQTLPAEYSGAIRVVSSQGTKILPVALTVEPVILPPPTMRANVAVYYDLVREWHEKNLAPMDDQKFAQLKTEYYEFLLDYRLNAYDLPMEWESDAAKKYLRDPRVLSVRLPPLDNPHFQTALKVLHDEDALHKAYYYWIDEPPPQRFDKIKATTQKLRAIHPKLKHCVTVHPNDSLDGFVDIWCPNIGDFFGLGNLDFERLKQERAKGNETWWYTMVEPKFPYPTWLIDDDAVAVRLYGWMMARHGLNGFVYSMAHGWGPKPFQNLQSFAGTNGDGTLLYPGAAIDPMLSGPLPSIRLMLLRDAIEDYELLRLLPPPQRENLTLRIVGDGLLRTQDDAKLWQSGQPRELLFQALRGVEIVAGKIPSAPISPPITLPENGAVEVDAVLRPGEWKSSFQTENFQRVPGENFTGSRLWAARDKDDLVVAMRGPLTGEARGEWAAIEIAPPDAAERWRFIVTAKGNAVVERHTREGRFAIEGIEWQHALKVEANSYVVEMRIPLEIIESPRQFRFNAVHRVYNASLSTLYLVRAFADAGDVERMPLVNHPPLPRSD